MSKTVTRQELFDAVWSRPMVRVARGYGISDVALKKICKKMAVPTPARGYWRRKELGYAVVTPALPKRPPNAPSEVEISPLPTPIRQTASSSAQLEGLAEALKAADQASDPHPLIQRARQSLAKAKVDERGMLCSQAKTLIDVTVSLGTLERALFAMDRVIKVLVSLGHRVRIDPEQKPRLRITVLDEELGLSLEEKVSARPYEPKPGDRHKLPWELPRYAYEPTGLLTVRVWGHLPYGLRTSWSDGKVQRVDDIAGKIIGGIFAAASAQWQKRLDDAQRAREREEERRQAEEHRRLRRLEAQRGKHLEKLAAQYSTAVSIRNFIEAAEREAERLSGLTVQGASLSDWLEWARAYAARIDPLGSPHWWDIDKQVPLWEIRESYY